MLAMTLTRNTCLLPFLVANLKTCGSVSSYSGGSSASVPSDVTETSDPL